MASVSKFNFDRVFELDESGRARPSNEPKPQFTDEDLAAARGEGQQIGFEAGLQRARGEIQATATRTLETIAGRLAELDRQHQQAVLAITADASRLALAIAGKLAPELLARQPLPEVNALIAECLAHLPTEPRFVVRVAEPLVDELNEGLDQVVRQAGFSGKLVLLGEAGLSDADCRVEWADGGAERNFNALFQRIEEAVSRYCAALADEAERLDEPDGGPAPAQDEAGDAGPGPDPLAAMPEDWPAEPQGPDPFEDALPSLDHLPEWQAEVGPAGQDDHS